MADKPPENTTTIDPALFQDPIGYFSQHQQLIIDFCTNILYALIILIIGWMIAKFAHFVTNKVMNKAHIETTVAKFVSNIIKYAILAFVITAALSRLGIQTASFVAIIGAASFAVGMSLQGSLSNFASGVLLLIFRPIKVGEYIDVAGQVGTVEEITIFTTTLLTVDNKIIVIPNSSISSGIITNYSRSETRRVDFTFGIEYGSDLKKAKEALTQMFKDDKRVLQDQGITVVVGALNASSIDIVCRVWVKNADYWDVFFDNNEKVVETLKDAGIGIPYQTITLVNKK